MRDTSFETFVTGIGFRWIQPLAPISRVQASLRARLDRTPLPLDVCITSLPERGVELRRRLLPLCGVPRMSTFAVASIINEAVARMLPGSAFVNVGVWNGFTLLSGMAGNAGHSCIGVDNFSEFGGPREAFLARFERARAARPLLLRHGLPRVLRAPARRPYRRLPLRRRAQLRTTARRARSSRAVLRARLHHPRGRHQLSGAATGDNRLSCRPARPLSRAARPANLGERPSNVLERPDGHPGRAAEWRPRCS